MNKIGCALLLGFAACTVGEEGGGGGGGGGKTASVTIAPTGADPAMGTGKFTLANGTVSVMITMTAGPAGTHGMHIHQVPMCGNAGMDAGGHWDGGATAGTAETHGLPEGATNHMGDLGNITLDAAGAGTLTRTDPDWKLGDGSLTDVVNHSIIFHTNADDGTMPSAGARLGCGIITLDS